VDVKVVAGQRMSAHAISLVRLVAKARTLAEKRSFIVRFDEWPRFSRILRVGLEVGLKARRPDAEFVERTAATKGDHHPGRFFI
jgi:hypothetical protein